MTILTPTVARDLWLALLDNASQIVVEADLLFPSPRAQSLAILALEEVGKALWISTNFWLAWNEGDETPLEVSQLQSQGRNHIAKLVEAIEFGTAMVELPGAANVVEIEIARAHAPDQLAAYLDRQARTDNESKKRGFYVDVMQDGTFVAPHEIDRPFLKDQIWSAAATIKWLIDEDSLIASIAGRSTADTEMVGQLLEPVLSRLSTSD